MEDPELYSYLVATLRWPRYPKPHIMFRHGRWVTISRPLEDG